MPRSGSSLLSEALAATGRLATPIEYFDGTGAYRWLKERWGCQDVADYVRLLHHRRVSAGGLLGAKLHWFHVEELSAELGTDPLAAMHLVFPRARFVHVRRRDRDRQAVSWAVAIHTGRWSEGAGVYPGDAPPPVYDFATIEECRERLVRSDAQWGAFFDGMGATPFVVDYEDLVADRVAAVTAVAEFLGEPMAASEVPPPRLLRQSGEHTEAIVERYRAERRSRG